MSSRLRASRHYDTGEQDYTAAGQADADLTSALAALTDVLKRNDLAPGQRRDFTAAKSWTERAARAVYRHMDYGDDDV